VGVSVSVCGCVDVWICIQQEKELRQQVGSKIGGGGGALCNVLCAVVLCVATGRKTERFFSMFFWAG
jgi:hypothetical protein